MKATINGARYNTEVATLIGEAGRGRQLHYWWAGLYRTPRVRRYFLAGWGAGMTRWAGDQGIIPLTPGEAVAWAKQYLPPGAEQQDLPRGAVKQSNEWRSDGTAQNPGRDRRAVRRQPALPARSGEQAPNPGAAG